MKKSNVIGTSVPRVESVEKVTGRAVYAVDISFPDMLWGKVLYPPQFGAALVSLDASAAEAMAGVKVVHEGNFVAVAAPDAEAAIRVHREAHGLVADSIHRVVEGF